ncbi:MAG: hypothetical protein QF450_09195 [Rhodospirillales bacterium]|jgi:hypothetical protein|nr:hypothetical protein [Rhodospirillales bacterium]HJO71445.1 hypothetical protein [Rhodospirillales bacterium]
MKKIIALATAGLFVLSTAAFAEGACARGAKQTASTSVPVETAQTPAPKPETKPGG